MGLKGPMRLRGIRNGFDSTLSGILAFQMGKEKGIARDLRRHLTCVYLRSLDDDGNEAHQGGNTPCVLALWILHYGVDKTRQTGSVQPDKFGFVIHGTCENARRAGRRLPK